MNDIEKLPDGYRLIVEPTGYGTVTVNLVFGDNERIEYVTLGGFNDEITTESLERAAMNLVAVAKADVKNREWDMVQYKTTVEWFKQNGFAL